MAETSPLGITEDNQNFDPLLNGPDDGQGSTDNADDTLSSDNRSSVRGVNDKNQNINNTASVAADVNNTGTGYSTGLVESPMAGYFNYRGINGKNFSDPNFVDSQHILTFDSIIDYFKDYPSFGLKYSHFYYLKKLGVYPNNRLIIARRYSTPTQNNMFNSDTDSVTPIATVVSWMDPNESLLELSFNEKWEDATDSLLDIFKDILSKDFGMSTDGFDLPGWSQGIQFAIMNALGITNTDSTNLPQGNPNFIHETQRRRVPGDDLGGSGLESNFKIKMVCEYEQKYKAGIDPEIAYLDVIGNLLMMGTSNAEFLITGGFTEKLRNLFDLAKAGKWGEMIKTILKSIIESVQDLINNIGDLLGGDTSPEESGEHETTYDSEPSGESEKTGIQSVIDGFDAALDIFIGGPFSKYREKMKAAIAAMSGEPNGPWHIMIGNPKNPFFVSGDMICDKVTIDFKGELAYNDLPQEYTATLEFSPARNLGGDEIASRLNHGKGRIYGKAEKNVNGVNKSPNSNRNSVAVTNKNANGQ